MVLARRAVLHLPRAYLHAHRHALHERPQHVLCEQALVCRHIRRAAELVAAQFDTVAVAAEGCDALAGGMMPAGVWL